MNYEYFIAKRIIGSKAYKSSISAPIIKIGIAAIAIGMVVMMIAIATGIGLQQKIRDKAVAFNGHVTISSFVSNASDESKSPIVRTQEFYPEFTAVEGVTHIQAVATKFGVIRTETDFEGVVLKGVGPDYSWSYFKDFLIDGELPVYSDTMNSDVLVSEYIANRLGFSVGASFQMSFVKEDQTKPPLSGNSMSWASIIPALPNWMKPISWGISNMYNASIDGAPIRSGISRSLSMTIAGLRRWALRSIAIRLLY